MRRSLSFFMTFLSLAGAACGGASHNSQSQSAQDRKAALDALDPILAALPVGNFDANTQRLVQSIKALPQFANAGSSPDGTVWGVFKDGVVVMVVPLPPPPGLPAPAPIVTTPAAETTTSSRVEALIAPTSGAVPKSSHFRLFNGLGSFFAGDDPRSEIQAMLTDNGYTGTSEEASLSTLRSVSGDGVFYIRTHGGMGSINYDVSTYDLYALWTASEVLAPEEENRDSTLGNDLLLRRVVYMMFRNDRWSQATHLDSLRDRHYGITGEFVSKYMSFADDSLAYVDACDGARDPNFRDAFKGKNASVFAGWDERAGMAAISKTSKYVFDRLLGANKFAPENPKQRPFPYDALARDPKFGTGQTYGYSEGLLSDGRTKVAATLDFYTLGGQFSMLAPSLWHVFAVEQEDSLYLTGLFGPDPGQADRKVTIDGGGEVALAVKNWSENLIQTDLPRRGNGSFGNVTVSVREHHSNKRQLLAWDGTFTYTDQYDGTLTKRIEMDTRFRMDPQDARNNPGEAPSPLPGGVLASAPNQDSEMRFEATGHWGQAVGQCTTTRDWTGSGTHQVALPSLNYVYAAQLDRQAGNMKVTAMAGDNSRCSETYRLICPPPEGTHTTNLPLGVGAAVVDLRVPIDTALHIAAGSQPVPSPTSHVTIRWTAMSPRPAFDDTLPR